MFNSGCYYSWYYRDINLPFIIVILWLLRVAEVYVPTVMLNNNLRRKTWEPTFYFKQYTWQFKTIILPCVSCNRLVIYRRIIGTSTFMYFGVFCMKLWTESNLGKIRIATLAAESRYFGVTQSTSRSVVAESHLQYLFGRYLVAIQ